MRMKSIACKTPRPRSTSTVARQSNSVDQVAAAVGDSSPNRCEDDDKSEQSDKGSPEVIIIQERTEPYKMEKHRCIKCDKVGIGKMLVCTEIECPVAIHKECLIPKPCFDDSGNFYCPYCAYKRAVDKVQRLRKKAMSAKEQLSNFLKVAAVDSNGGKEDGNEKKEKTATAFPQSEDKIHYVDEIQPNQHVDETEKCDKENEETDQKGHKEIGSSEKTNNSTGESNESHESHSESVSENVENRSDESHNVTVSEGSEIVQHKDKAPKSSTHVKQEDDVFPTIGKRKRMAWTLEEEVMLKDGVKIFSDPSKNLPWRKILQYGSHVFHQSRLPADLQNKWKNMTRKF